MQEKKITDKDIERAVALLNFVAKRAEFNGMTVSSVLEFTKLLNWAQTELLPKLESNKFQVVALHEPTKPKGKK